MHLLVVNLTKTVINCKDDDSCKRTSITGLHDLKNEFNNKKMKKGNYENRNSHVMVPILYFGTWKY